jgi:flavin reductase (DIM6/NTAB) family NADH-FMN oxidoreductase RutF
MSVEKTFFREVMGRFATGVTVVTTRSHRGLAGLTVNSFCSVSLDPLLVLVCIELSSNTLPYFRESGSFVVNILSDQQEYLSRCFATPSQERYEYFCNANYQLAATGSPIIADVLAFIEARIVGEYSGGDHVIFVGQVESMGIGNRAAFIGDASERPFNLAEYHGNGTIDDQAEPLAYYRGQYRHLAPDYKRPGLTGRYEEQRFVKINERS